MFLAHVANAIIKELREDGSKGKNISGQDWDLLPQILIPLFANRTALKINCFVTASFFGLLALTRASSYSS